METTVVYDVITGTYIQRVPIYKAKNSCSMKPTPEKHLWILNSAHKKVCIRCGLNCKITSFYKFTGEVGIIPMKETNGVKVSH